MPPRLGGKPLDAPVQKPSAMGVPGWRSGVRFGLRSTLSLTQLSTRQLAPPEAVSAVMAERGFAGDLIAIALAERAAALGRAETPPG